MAERLPGIKAGGGQEGNVLEVSNALGDTIALVTVPVTAVKLLRASEVLCVRSLQLTD